MPRPPDIDDFAKINFVTNALMAGCNAPAHLFFECAREPLGRLAMLFLLPDLMDIGQAIFDPKGGRRRKPGRHGRKSGRGPGFPDVSDMVGQRARGVLNPHNALSFGPVNKAFRIFNAYEGFAITVALLEGVTEVGYGGLLGVLTLDPNQCSDFGRLVKRKSAPEFGGGIGVGLDPIVIDVIEAQKEIGTWLYGCSHPSSSIHVNMVMRIRNNNFGRPASYACALGDAEGNVLVESNRQTLLPLETGEFTVEATFGANVAATWGVGHRTGFYDVMSAEIVAFEKQGIPWPW